MPPEQWVVHVPRVSAHLVPTRHESGPTTAYKLQPASATAEDGYCDGVLRTEIVKCKAQSERVALDAVLRLD